MSREELLRFFKQWSNEDRNVAANVATMLGLIGFWKPSPQAIDIQGYVELDDNDPEDYGHAVSFFAGQIVFRPEYAPTGALPCEGSWPGSNGWFFIPLSRRREGPGRTSTAVSSVVVCNTDGCSQQWLAHAGPCD
jgi:hypothetical protein